MSSSLDHWGGGSGGCGGLLEWGGVSVGGKVVGCLLCAMCREWRVVGRRGGERAK